MNQELTPITEYTLKDYALLKEGNKLKSIYLNRWIENKKRQTLTYISFCFDSAGELYFRDALVSNEWRIVPEQESIESLYDKR